MPFVAAVQCSLIFLLGVFLRETRSESVIILGAGAAGIAAAHRLREEGITDILILEGGSQIGGRMKSAGFAGKTVEHGANYVIGRDPTKHRLAGLQQKFGLNCSQTNWESWWDYDDQGYTEQVPWGVLDVWTRAPELQSNFTADNRTDVSCRKALELLGWQPQSKYEEAVMTYAIDWGSAASSSAVSFKCDYFGYPSADDYCFVNDPRGFKYVLDSMAHDAGFAAQIRLNQVVHIIAHSETGVVVETADSVYQADHVIVTFSVGVLQSDLVRFHPPLPGWKVDAIQGTGMGLYLKVFFEFPWQFWPDVEYIQYVDSTPGGYYQFWMNFNHGTHLGPGPPYILMVSVVNVHAERVLRQPRNQTMEEALRVLRSMFPSQTLPEPTDMLFHDWLSDPLSRGSYSYTPVGYACPEDTERLCARVGPIWFAGEACKSRRGFVHYAMESGNDTATALAEHIRGSPRGIVSHASSVMRPSLLWWSVIYLACRLLR